MQPYKSKSNKPSGVIGFEIKEDGIIIKFESASYLYTYSSAGKNTIEEMKSLALSSQGLSTFISQNNPPYTRKY